MRKVLVACVMVSVAVLSATPRSRGASFRVGVEVTAGRSHEAPNLGVLGGAVMPTQGSRNPTLTLQAIAWRTADHLVKNWKAIAE
jgi:choline dehydrogenase-like flavoprotein